ncbi:MAG: polysaccharide deacetylase family protein [Kiritimatiellae bacterium]|nr:polysaccharide deacetylase family protein [Kiritimatiellia bacterium]
MSTTEPPAAAINPEPPSNDTLYNRRPTPPVKVAYTTSWLHFLAALCLLVAWWVPVKIVMERVLWPRARHTGPRDAVSFVAIAYEGVSTKEGDVSPDRFREHIEALKAAGYQPIRLADVDALFRDGRPLPRRAVLVTFDHSRKTSYFATHSVLRRTGWNAVMFLWTKPIVDGDPAALLWPYLRSMLRSGLWEIGAESHEGVQRIVSSPKGLTGNFMTAPLWKADEQRFETLEEFQARLDRDHRTCRELIERNLGVTPLAYAYPFGDFGQYQHRAVATRPINLGLVGRHYRLGFIVGNLALNTRFSDPRRLNRLLVRPEWSGADLVRRLDLAWPNESPILEKDGRPIASAWVVDWGEMSQEPDGSLVLFASTNATGAKMWLAGSDLNSNFYARVRFRLERGQLGLYLRASPDSESYVYVGLDPAGEVWLRQLSQGRERVPIGEDAEDTGVWLRQKFVGSERFTLASSRVPLSPTKDHTLELYLRDRLLFARLDGKEVFQSRGMLRGDVRPGMVGISVWAAQRGVARARLRGVEVREQSPMAVSLAGGPAEPYAFRWVHQEAYRLTELCPIWDDRTGGGSLASPAEIDVYRLAARVNHLRYLPQVLLPDEKALQRAAPTLLAERAIAQRFDGLFVNLSAAQDAGLPAIASWLRQCGSMLATNGLRLLVRLPPTLETRSHVASLLAMVPQAQIAVAAGSPLTTGQTATGVSVVKVEEVPAPASEEEMPLFFMIPGAAERGGIETEESRAARLQQEGLAAYLDGQYDRAVQLWQEWRSIEPENPKVYMLIGDALSRKGDLRGAVEHYDRSLDLDPGQITLAIRRAGVLVAMGESERAMQSLNLYARLFPGNPDILLAQARWLVDNRRTDEALDAARKLLKVQPEHVEALAMVVRHTRDAAEYRNAIERLANAGLKPFNHLPFAQSCWKYELPALPAAAPLMATLRAIAADNRDPRIAELCARLLPVGTPAVETMAEGRLSNRWWIEGGDVTARAGGGIRLAAGEAYAEASARLLGSLQTRDALVEASVGGIHGGVWLYARRTERHLVRFGFTEGRLHLQVWRDGRLLQEMKREWIPPAGFTPLRLEVNGRGAMGFVDGEPAFATRLVIPSDIRAGWIGLAVHSPTRGQAAAEFTSLRAGPLQPRLAALAPTSSGDETDQQLAAIRNDTPFLTALCPAWFTVETDGRWTGPATPDPAVYHIFARYHRIWLLPMVECRSAAGAVPSEIEGRVRQVNADGLVLAFRTWPGDDWISALAERLAASGLTIIVLGMDTAAQSARCAVISGGSVDRGEGDGLRLRIARRASLTPADLAGFEGLLIGY